MTVVARKESRNLVTMPKNKGLTCMSYEDTLREMEAFLDGKIDKPQSSQNLHADITEPMSSCAIRLPDKDDPDATENSSSFGDTASWSENVSGTSDAEVESEYHVGGNLGSTLDDYVPAFPVRKRKLTTHWRSFIRPLMWRCKWTELKIKELELQAQKYTRELEANDQTKMLELHQYTSDFCSKSFPFFNHSKKRKPMKRRKRKLVENVTDISSYMSQHQLFSYIENKKIDLDGTSTTDDIGIQDFCSNNGEFDMDNDWLRDGEDASGQILRQIEKVQSVVQRVRAHLDMVMLRNGVKFSSSENLSLLAPNDAQTSAAQSPAFSAGNGDAISMDALYVASQHLPDFEIDDLVLPDSIISCYGDGTQIPDIIESTVGLLSAADVTIHQHQIMESGENTLEDTLMVQKQVLQDVHIPNGVNGYHDGENKEVSMSKVSASNGVLVDPVTVEATAEEKLTIKSCLTSDIQIPKNKRKRGERKAGPGGWNLRSSGEPDSN